MMNLLLLGPKIIITAAAAAARRLTTTALAATVRVLPALLAVDVVADGEFLPGQGVSKSMGTPTRNVAMSKEVDSFSARTY